MGLVIVDRPEPEALELWPENLTPMCVFRDLLTQWRVSASGTVIGLAYESLPLVLRLNRVKPKHERRVFDALRVMEDEALQIFNTEA